MKHPDIRVAARTQGFEKVHGEDFLDFEHTDFEGRDFSNRKARSLSVHGCKFVECRFDNLRLDTASFGAGRAISEYIGCSFDRLRFRTGIGGYSRFEKCSFHNVDLRDWFCFAVEFVDCTFSGRMRKVVFNGTPRLDDEPVVHRKHNAFHGNDFSQVAFEDVSFRTGIDLSKQAMPSGPDYVHLVDAAAAMQNARAEILQWKDMEARRQAMILLNLFEGEIQAGQQQLLLRPADYPKSLRQGSGALFDLLRRGA